MLRCTKLWEFVQKKHFRLFYKITNESNLLVKSSFNVFVMHLLKMNLRLTFLAYTFETKSAVAARYFSRTSCIIIVQAYWHYLCHNLSCSIILIMDFFWICRTFQEYKYKYIVHWLLNLTQKKVRWGHFRHWWTWNISCF